MESVDDVIFEFFFPENTKNLRREQEEKGNKGLRACDPPASPVSVAGLLPAVMEGNDPL